MSKIKISSVNNKLYSHSYRCTNSTSANFSYVQPLLCRLQMPNSTIKGSMRQFTRLSAMPKPTFGDMRVENAAFFVPIEEVCPEFMSIMSGTPYTTGVGVASVRTSVQTISNRELWLYLYGVDQQDNSDAITYTIPINGPEDGSLSPTLISFEEWYQRFYEVWKNENKCYLRIWVGDDETGSFEYINTYNSFFIDLCKKYESKEYTLEQCNNLYNTFCSASSVSVGQTNGSYADITNFQNASDSYDALRVSYSGSYATSSVVGYRLSNQGRSLRKIFIGLGYQPSYDDTTRVSALPLFAFYKAYFDRFQPYRSAPWETTQLFQLISSIERTSASPTLLPEVGSSTPNVVQSYFNNFIYDELSHCFSIKDTDFCSLHQYSLGETYSGRSETLPISGVFPSVIGVSRSDNGMNPDGDGVSILSGDAGSGLGVLGTGNQISALTIRLLSKMYGYLGRDSIIGNRLELWAKSHLNSDVYNNMFKRSNCLSSSKYQISISDVDSLANTRNASNEGDVLGNYAGKGIGSGDLKFSHKCSTYGYFIVMNWINPQTSWYQGTDAQLFATSRYTFPQKEWDAFGYEITPRSVFWTDNDICCADDTAFSAPYIKTISSSDGFGFVPRYSGFKYAKNIVNGDMSLRSVQNSMRPFYLDRKWVNRELVFADVVNGVPVGPVHVRSNQLPVASPVWRYTQRYPWLGNYNEVFYNSRVLSSGLDADGYPIEDAYLLYPQDDNFFIHCVFDFTENTPLRPLSESYDTEVLSSDSKMTVSGQ